MEQPEYTKTPRGLARQSETLEAKCIPAAGYREKNLKKDLFGLF